MKTLKCIYFTNPSIFLLFPISVHFQKSGKVLQTDTLKIQSIFVYSSLLMISSDLKLISPASDHPLVIYHRPSQQNLFSRNGK